MVERASGAIRARHGVVGPIGGFLERFRRLGGVPAAAGGEPAAELAPVFAALDRLEGEAAEILRRADLEAARRAHESEEQAQHILTEARGRADAERDDALKASRRVTDTEVVSILEQAELDALQISKAGEERLPALVAVVLGRVLEAGS